MKYTNRFFRVLILVVFSLFILFSFSCKNKKSEQDQNSSGEGLEFSVESDLGAEIAILANTDPLVDPLEGDTQNGQVDDELLEVQIEEEVEVDLFAGLTLAEQIKLKKKLDKESSSVESETGSSSDSSDTIVENQSIAPKMNEIREFTDSDGAVIKQKRVGSIAFKRADDGFSFKRRWDRQLPADFRIGSLVDLQSTDFQTKTVIKNLRSFFIKLAEEKVVDSEYIFPEAVDLIKNNLGYYIESGALPDTLFRIGELTVSGSIIRVNVRFYYNDSSTDGEVILEEIVRKGIKNWLITDIQVDFMKLLIPYEGYKEPFLPSSYSQFDWE